MSFEVTKSKAENRFPFFINYQLIVLVTSLFFPCTSRIHPHTCRTRSKLLAFPILSQPNTTQLNCWEWRENVSQVVTHGKQITCCHLHKVVHRFLINYVKEDFLFSVWCFQFQFPFWNYVSQSKFNSTLIIHECFMFWCGQDECCDIIWLYRIQRCQCERR